MKIWLRANHGDRSGAAPLLPTRREKGLGDEGETVAERAGVPVAWTPSPGREAGVLPRRKPVNSAWP
jgi:hypothetical protein